MISTKNKAQASFKLKIFTSVWINYSQILVKKK